MSKRRGGMLWARLDVTLKPDDCWAHARLGETLYALGKAKRPRPNSGRRLVFAPNNAANCWDIAMAMRAQGYPDPAIELFRRMADWDDEHLDVTGGGVWELGHTLCAAGWFRRSRGDLPPHQGVAAPNLRKPEVPI